MLARLAEYASYQEKMASRLSHELRTPIAVVRSSLDNLKAAPLPADARVYMERAQEGLARLTQILTRMTEAARLEQSLSDVEREPLRRRRGGRAAASTAIASRIRRATSRSRRPPSASIVDGAPDLIAQMLDKLVANAVEFAAGGAIDVRVARDGGDVALTRRQRRAAAAGGDAGAAVRIDGVGARGRRPPPSRTWASGSTSCG